MATAGAESPSSSQQNVAFTMFKNYANASLSGPQEVSLPKLVECGKKVLESKVSNLVEAAGKVNQPLLRSYGSDGTPLSVKMAQSYTTSKKKSLGTLKVRRYAKGTQEYLVQSSTYRYYDLHGDPQTAILVKDPQPLTNGKSAGALFACAKNFSPP